MRQVLLDDAPPPPSDEREGPVRRARGGRSSGPTKRHASSLLSCDAARPTKNAEDSRDQWRGGNDGRPRDRLHTWCAETGKGSKASHFAMRGTANRGPAASLTSLMGQDCCDALSGLLGMGRCRGSRLKWSIARENDRVSWTTRVK